LKDFLLLTVRFLGLHGTFSSLHYLPRPFPDVDTPAKYDEAYMRTAKTYNKLYMAAVSPCLFTHFPWKNWVYPDSTLLTRRFQELVQSQPDLIEIISWNGISYKQILLTKTGANLITLEPFRRKREYQKALRNGLRDTITNPGSTFANILFKHTRRDRTPQLRYVSRLHLANEVGRSSCLLVSSTSQFTLYFLA
jgi:Glycosyl hydrolase family 71